MTVYLLSVWLHVLAAAAWIGSMVFFAAVVVPLLRRPDMRASAPSLIRLLGARYRVLGWVALATLLVTGVANLYYRGIGWTVLRDPEFWAGAFGKLLAWKVALVGVVVVLTALHEVTVGKRAVDALESGSDRARANRIRLAASVLGRLTMLVSLVILFLAIAMVRGCG